MDYFGNRVRALLNTAIFVKTAEQRSMVIDGSKIQGVGMRRTLHDYLEKEGIPGIAVNDAKTGNVEVTVDPPEGIDANEVLETLKGIADDRAGVELIYRMLNRPLRMKYSEITKEDMERFNRKSYEGFLRSSKLKPEMRFSTDPLAIDDVIRETIERYRLRPGEDDIAMRGALTARALRQLKSRETQYAFMRKENLVRSRAEGYKLLAGIKARRLAEGKSNETDYTKK